MKKRNFVRRIFATVRLDKESTAIDWIKAVASLATIAIGFTTVWILYLQLESINDQNAAMWFGNRPILHNRIATGVETPVVVKPVISDVYTYCDSGDAVTMKIVSNIYNIGKSPAILDSIKVTTIFCDNYYECNSIGLRHTIVPNDTFYYPIYFPCGINNNNLFQIDAIYGWEHYAVYEKFSIKKTFAFNFVDSVWRYTVYSEDEFDSLRLQSIDAKSLRN